MKFIVMFFLTFAAVFAQIKYGSYKSVAYGGNPGQPGKPGLPGTPGLSALDEHGGQPGSNGQSRKSRQTRSNGQLEAPAERPGSNGPLKYGGKPEYSFPRGPDGYLH